MSNDVPFVPTPESVIERMLELCELKPSDVVYDLGCGDGRIITTAAEKFGVKALGVEIREDLIQKAEERIQKLNLTDSVKVIKGNFFDVDISEADVVTLYLLSKVNSQLKPKLEKELKKGTRIVSHSFEVEGWKPIKKEELKGFHSIFLYKR